MKDIQFETKDQATAFVEKHSNFVSQSQRSRLTRIKEFGQLCGIYGLTSFLGSRYKLHDYPGAIDAYNEANILYEDFLNEARKVPVQVAVNKLFSMVYHSGKKRDALRRFVSTRVKGSILEENTVSFNYRLKGEALTFWYKDSYDGFAINEDDKKKLFHETSRIINWLTNLVQENPQAKLAIVQSIKDSDCHDVYNELVELDLPSAIRKLLSHEGCLAVHQSTEFIKWTNGRGHSVDRNQPWDKYTDYVCVFNDGNQGVEIYLYMGDEPTVN